MFFRRMFARKDSSGSGGNTAYDYDDGDAHGNDGESDEFGAFGGASTARNKHQSNGNGLHMNGDGSATATGSNGTPTSSSSDYELQRRRNERRKYGASTAPTGSATSASKHYGSASTLHRAATSGPATVQLTPLWEHILRTRTLPENVYPVKIFGEFLERLRDPEWQVRQHALRVFVDVLVVMRDEADAYMDPLIPPLVENLGHQAPTVRKGALDCLRVYLAETAMPETILLQILDIGLNQKITNEPFGGRLTCGVMLSLPALVQSTLHTGKRHYILRTAVEMLVQKMGQVTHQEITLKVLSKLRDLVGEEEFREYMSNSAYREFDLLCNVYGVEAKTDCNGNRHGSAHRKQNYGSSVGAHTWRVLAKQPVASCWRSSDEEQMLEEAAKGKVIMETEIKINDDTLTMRILEAKDEDTEADADTDSSPHKSVDTYPNSLEDDVVCGRIPSATNDSLHELSAVVRLLSDSELDMEEDNNDLVRASHRQENPEYYTVITPSTPSRTPKRVTFGGEVVKMRTPDSDANSSNNRNGNGVGPQMLFAGSMGNQSAIDAGGGNGSTGGGASSDSSEPLQRTITTTTTTTTEITIISTPSTSATSSPVPEDSSKMMALSVEIINDNTKPLPMAEQSTTVPRPRTAQSPRRSQVSTNGNAYINTPTLSNESASNSSTTVVAHSPPKRRDSVGSAGLSPRTPFKRLSVSPVDNIISPKTPHKPIEVMHNLQRDPSPVRARSAKRVETTSNSTNEADVATAEVNTLQASKATQAPQAARAQTPSPLPPKTWEELDIVDFDTLLDLRSGNWHHRLQGVTQLEEALRNSDILAQVQPCLDSLLRTLLSSERNPDVAEAKTQLLINLITRLPLDNLEDRTTQIMTGLCRQGGAGANRVCKALMHRLPAAAIVLKLLSQEFLHAKSSRFREHALQMVMYALMTFPSTCFDTTTCVTHATYAALNRKRRVRQAALDVLAILGQITTVRAVVDVVQDVVGEREDGPALLSAVRTRLSRKQMPIVGADGQVQYALRVPSPHSAEAADAANGEMGADIEWIVAGVGSVSPGSLKRRASRRSFRCLPPHTASDVDSIAMGTPCGSFRIGDGDGGTRRHAFQSPPDVYGNFKDSSASNNDLHTHNFHHILGSNVPLAYGHNTKKTTNVDYNNYMSRRLVAKSCSDSSMEGRSSDSNYTSSSGGGGGGGGSVGSTADKSAAKCNGNGKPATNDSCTGISGRFTRQTVNSRFPAMDRMDVNSTYMRVHKPPTYMTGMGAYAQLQQQQMNISSTYPKINYGGMPTTQPQQQRRRSQQQQQQQRHAQHSSLAQPIVVGTRAMQAARGSVFAPENFRSAENSPKEHNKNSNNATPDGNTNNDLDGTYTIYTSIDNNGNTPAAQATATARGSQNLKQQQQQHTSGVTANGRRFVNVEKFVMQSNRLTPSDGEAALMAAAAITDLELQQQINEAKQVTPISLKSSTYSRKSTVSAQSAGGVANSTQGTPKLNHDSVDYNLNSTTDKEDTTDNGSMIRMGALQDACSDNESSSPTPAKWRSDPDVLQLEDVQDDNSALNVAASGSATPLRKNGSLASLHSKSESIKTQLGDTPTVLSRTQSAKSLLIEEDIEDNGSFVVMEELHTERQSSGIREQSVREMSAGSKDDTPRAAYGNDNKCTCQSNAILAQPQTPLHSRPPTRSRSPTIAEIKLLSRRNSMIKSMESLYERPPSKQELIFDNTSTESGSAASSQLNTTIPIKPQHTPLKQKAKTSHFLKNHRRVSPVKQAIKMPQAELYPPTMQRFEKPRDALLKTFDQLDSTNWEVIILGLKSMVRLMRYHAEYLENQMHMVCIQLTRSVRNLRSQVARAACQAATELFSLKSKCLEQECDDLVCALLHRTADTNRFLRADATRALESMCDNLTPPKILNILTTKGAVHQNALVRTTTAKLLHRLVERLGSDKVYTMPRDNRDKFFVTGANLLLEGSLETRSYAKSIFRLLSDHPTYNRLLIEVIPTRTYRNVEKTLKSIR